MLKNFVSKNIFDTLGSNAFNVSSNIVGVQSVRWRTKPRWVPMARSKLFKIPVPFVLPEDERCEFLRLNQNYKCQMRSVRSFLVKEVQRKKSLAEASMTVADEEAEFQRCSEVNDSWNLEIARIRDERLAKENAERKEFIAKRLELKKIREQKQLERIEARVREEKEASATFITRENIDQAIEEALANPVDFNFSIDLEGNLYKGNERPGKKVPKADL